MSRKLSQALDAAADSLQSACEQLWSLDVNRLKPRFDYAINPQTSLDGYQDAAHEQLVVSLSDHVWSRPTYASFRRLLDNYTTETGIPEIVSQDELDEQHVFLAEISNTDCIQFAYQWLLANSYTSAETIEDFQLVLHEIWFQLYSRDDSRDTSAFENVFIGELDDGEVKGLHNFYQVYLQELRGNFNYIGYLDQHDSISSRPAPTSQQLITIRFEWLGEMKQVSSMFVGPSPEFEFALYTILFLSHEQSIKLQLGPYSARIKVYEMDGCIDSAFPELLAYDFDDFDDHQLFYETVSKAEQGPGTERPRAMLDSLNETLHPANGWPQPGEDPASKPLTYWPQPGEKVPSVVEPSIEVVEEEPQVANVLDEPAPEAEVENVWDEPEAEAEVEQVWDEPEVENVSTISACINVEDALYKVGDSLEAAMSVLWDLDANRLTAGRDYEVNLQTRSDDYYSDAAEESLVTHVSDDVWERATFGSLKKLLDNYTAETGVPEVVSQDERAEEGAFLDAICETSIAQFSVEWLANYGDCGVETMDDLRALLQAIWFDLYERDASRDSSGFEHVFIGELDEGEVKGLHNFYQVYTEERRGNLDYKGYLGIRGSECEEEATYNQQVITIRFEWLGERKSASSMFVGASPEFEIMLYTMMFVMGEESMEVEMGAYTVRLRVYQQDGKLGAAFPELVAVNKDLLPADDHDAF